MAHPQQLSGIFAGAASREAFSDQALLHAMCAFESALAGALTKVGEMPKEQAEVIESVCREAQFDAGSLVARARTAGTIVIPFVADLTALVAAKDATAAGFVHQGATSQDVVDTALVLCARVAHAAIGSEVLSLGSHLKAACQRYRTTPAIARTLLQPATPIPFGLRLAGWLHLLARSRVNLERAFGSFDVLQFGGASGSLGSYGPKGAQIASEMGARLGLAVPGLPWHSARDDVARLGTELSVLCGVCGKMAWDVALMAQPELNEVTESSADGRGGSSAMPHKRNPAGSLLAIEASNRAPSLAIRLLSSVATPFERGLGTWQYDFWTLGELYGASESAVTAMRDVLANWSVNEKALAQNIDRGGGLVYSEALARALGGFIGKSAASKVVRECCETALRTGRSLAEVASGNATVKEKLSAAALDECFLPQAQFGSAVAFIDHALQEWDAAAASS